MPSKLLTELTDLCSPSFFTSTPVIHVAGPAGSGKSTLVAELRQYPQIEAKDLDDFAEQARKGLPPMEEWDEQMVRSYAAKRGYLMKEWIHKNRDSKLVLAGANLVPMADSTTVEMLEIPIAAQNRFLIDISAEEATKRAVTRLSRSITEEDLNELTEQAQQLISWYEANSYVRIPYIEIVEWIERWALE